MADDLLNSIIDGTTLNGEYDFIDADTIRDKEGKSYRVQGFDAPEISKYTSQGKQYGQGTEGAAEVTESIQNLAREQGFTNVVQDERGAAHGRGLVDLQNEKGESFTTKLIRTGAFDPTSATSRADIDAKRVTDLFGNQLAQTQNEAGDIEAAHALREAMGRGPQDDLEFKERALSELQYAFDKGKTTTSNLQFDNLDRNLSNKANNPFSEAWDVGVDSLVEAGYGVAMLLGDVTDTEALSEIGNAGTARAQARAQEAAKFISSYTDVKGFGDAVEFLGTNMAMSLPYMGAIMAGTAAGPVGLAGVAGLYSGGVYSDQPDDQKNAGIAIASGVVMAALDRLGLDLVLKPGPPKELFNKAVDALVKKGVPKAEAAKVFSDATRREIAGLSKDTAKVAADQLKKKRLFMDTLSGIGRAGVGEGVTEALQETIGYLGSHPEGDINWDELQQHALHAAVAGASLGGVFGGVGTAKDKLGWADAAWKVSEADPAKQSQSAKIYEDEVKHYARQGREVPTVDNLTERAGNEAEILKSKNPLQGPDGLTEQEFHDIQKDGLDAFANLHAKNRGELSFTDKVLDAAGKPLALFKGSLDFMFNPEIKGKYRAVRELSGMFGGGVQKIYSGATYENFKHHVVTKYKTSVPTPEAFYERFGVGSNDNKGKAKVSKEVYTQARAAIDPETKTINADLIPEGPNKRIIVRFAKDLQKLGDQMYADQKQHNAELGYVDNYLLKYKAFDKSAIASDRNGFIENLMNIEGMNISRADANAIAESIIENDQVNDLAEAFTLVKGSPVPASHKKRSLGLSERAEFDRFMDPDVFSNVSKAAKAASRYIAHDKYVGRNGEKVSAMLVKAMEEGMPAAEAAKLGKQIKDYLDADSGNYKRPTSQQGKDLIKVQKNFIFLTTISSLWTATISSLPELALTTKGLTPKDLGEIKNLAKDAAKKMTGTLNTEANDPKNLDEIYDKMKNRGTAREQATRNAGFYDWDVGAATTSGVTEVSAVKQKWLKRFFKANGLSQYTDMTRAMRISFAGDFMMNHIDVILNHPEGTPQTNEVQESKEKLRNIGMNITPQSLRQLRSIMQKDPETLTDQESALYDDLTREATYNFVNDAIVTPTAGNRPLFYSDPRFAMFTQFQGFMATFTAKIIPQLWGEYIKRGSPAMQYSAFATMAGMIAMGFLSQHIKDLLKFGEETPYLDEDEYIRRGIESSGLLGTASRITDALFPMYEDRSKNAAEWSWNAVSGQSPGLSKAGQAIGTAGEAIQGDASAPEKAIKLTGIPTTGISKAIQEGWNYLK